MFHDLTAFVTPLMEKYGALGVFLASVIEEIIAPIPSSIVVLSSGFFMTQGATDLSTALPLIMLKIMLPAALGITIGSLFPYFVARIGGELAIHKLGWLLGVDGSSLKKAEDWFLNHKYEELLLLFARMVPVIPSVVIGLFCGAVRMPVYEFLIWTFLGSLVRTFVMGFLGWYAGQAYMDFADQISQFEDSILYVFVILGVMFAAWWFLRLQKKKGWFRK